MEALKVQNQIRQNAEEISGFFSDLAKWEKDIKLKDKKIQEKKNHATPVRGAGAIKISSTATTTTSPNSNISKLNSAAQHTYDIGYERWNKLDENKLLENIDNPINLTPAHLVPNAPEIPQVIENILFYGYCL